MSSRESLTRQSPDKVAIELLPRESISFTRLLPVAIPNDGNGDLYHAAIETNLVTEALNVAGWTALAIQNAEGIDSEYSQEHARNLLKIFQHISLLQDFNRVPSTLNAPLFNILSRLLTSHVDTQGVLPQEARRHLESLRSLQTKLILQQPLDEGDKSSFMEVTSSCFGTYVEEIRGEIEASKTLKGGEYMSYDEFCANTSSHTTPPEAIATIGDNISNIAHDMGTVIGRYTNKRVRVPSGESDGNDLSSLQGIEDMRSSSLDRLQKNMWDSLFNFFAAQVNGLERGLINEIRTVSSLASIINRALNEVIHLNFDLRFEVASGTNENARVDLCEADLLALVGNVLQNAQRIIEAKWDLERQETGSAITEKLTLQTTIATVSELPVDAGISSMHDGAWMRLAFDDDGLGIKQKVKGILGSAVFKSGEHGYASESVKSNGDGMLYRQGNIEKRAGCMIVRNRVVNPDRSIDVTRDIADPRPVVGARLEVYLPIIPGL